MSFFTLSPETEAYRSRLLTVSDLLNSPTINEVVALTDYVTREIKTCESHKADLHTILVNVAKNTLAIQNEIHANKKILAIKELRRLTLCSLKEAKDAIDAVWNVNPNEGREAYLSERAERELSAVHHDQERERRQTNQGDFI